MSFFNAYEDSRMAEAYSRLDFPGTYYLAYRDLPKLISTHVVRPQALDFGCGAGRSTRFLKSVGFETVGVDISENMLRIAKKTDPEGKYHLINDNGLELFNTASFDLVLSAFTFDNIPGFGTKVKLFRDLTRILKRKGKLINLVSSPEMYTHEWASFSTRDFPENESAKCGDIVKIINTSIDHSSPVDDILWPDEDYRLVYKVAGLRVLEVHKPLADGNEPIEWINETRIAPWTIYLLGREC
jgi:SAM-dependent methyltransferase